MSTNAIIRIPTVRSPLKPTDESIMADTSDLELKESVDMVINIIKESMQ